MKQQEVFGRIVKDKLTRKEGLCYGAIDWMFGCRLYLVKQTSKTDNEKETVYSGELSIPEINLELVDPVPAVDAAFPEDEEPKYFGKICRDKVTGYKGMCIGRYWTYYAEKEYCIQAKYNKKRSIKPTAMWVDEGRIEEIPSRRAVDPDEMRTSRPGGAIDIPTPGHYLSEADMLNI